MKERVIPPIHDQSKRKAITMKLKVEPTKEQMADLKKLAKAIVASKEASSLKKRLASFRDDNANVLIGDGIELDGMNIRVKVTRELIVEAV